MSLPPTPDLIESGVTIDLHEAKNAPTVDDAPVRAGMLLAQLNLDSTADFETPPLPGQPYLLTQHGQWRTFDLLRYGFASPVYGELSMAISADGSRVAFADPSGLVTVDLTDNTFERFALAVDEAIALTWSPDETSLLLKDRHGRRQPCGPTGCRLELDTGRLIAVPFNMFHSTYDDAGAVVEIKRRKRGWHVVTHHANGLSEAVPISVSTAAYTAGGPTAARRVAYPNAWGASACVTPA